MARILAYTSPGRSHLFPLTPILDELHGRGHEIVSEAMACTEGAQRIAAAYAATGGAGAAADAVEARLLGSRGSPASIP